MNVGQKLSQLCEPAHLVRPAHLICRAHYSKPRKPPVKITFQQDQYQKFLLYDCITDLTCLDENLTLPGCFKSYTDHVIYHRCEIDNLSFPKVNKVIRTDKEPHVKLFYKGPPIPLPTCFHH